MAISKLVVTDYVGKVDGDEFHASTWNSYVNLAANKVNEIIDAVNEGGSTPTEEDEFYVNGVLTTPTSGKITLAACGYTGYPSGGYILSGTLTGQIVIGTSDDEPTDDTQVVLNGVTIKTTSTDNSAIMYAPSKQTLVVTLAKNALNYLVCSNSAAKADSQKGCLWSEDNMVILGNGYLACKNLGGHGIKASNLRFWGNPHIYCDAIHDGIHGNEIIDLCGGLYYVTNCNDGFGTRAEEGTSGDDDYKAAGRINIYKADIYAYGISESGYVLDSKASGTGQTDIGHIFGDFSIHTDSSAESILYNMTKIDPKVYFGEAEQDTVNGGYIAFAYGTEGLSTAYTKGTVKCYSDEDMTKDEETITEVDEVYTVPTGKPYVKVSGYIEGAISTSLVSTDITLNNAYIVGNIEYTPTSKKLGIKVEKGNIGMIVGKVTSSSNLALEVKNTAHFVIEGDMQGDEVTFADSKGVAIIKGNVQGKNVYIGGSVDKNATENYVLIHDQKVLTNKHLDGALIIEGTLKAILNTKFNKGWVTVLNVGTCGVVCMDKIDTEGYADFEGSNHVFYHSASGIVIGSKTVENADYVSI